MTPGRLTTRSKDGEFPEPLFTIVVPSCLPEAIADGPPAGALAGYDIVLVNSSAGKGCSTSSPDEHRRARALAALPA